MSQSKPISYERYYRCANYMYREMTTNIKSNEVGNIRYLLRPHDGLKDTLLGRNLAQDIITAKAVWASKVGPHMDWDHKPKLKRLLNLVKGDEHFPIDGDGLYEWFYDVWSNIHYGYVGMCAGFTEDDLINGARVPILAGDNDAMDDATVRIGVRMWQSYGPKIYVHTAARELLKRRNWLINTVQQRSDYKQRYGGWAHILPMAKYGNRR